MGVLFTVFSTLVIFSQVIVQGWICANKTRPLFTQTTVENARTHKDVVDLGKFNFMVGFGVRDSNSLAFLHDTNLVEFAPIIEERKLG